MYPAHMMNQTVNVHRLASTNDYSEASYQASVEVQARVELVNKSIRTANGEDITISAEIWMPPDTAVEVGDKIDYDETDYRVITREAVPDGSGTIRMKHVQVTEWI